MVCHFIPQATGHLLFDEDRLHFAVGQDICIPGTWRIRINRDIRCATFENAKDGRERIDRLVKINADAIARHDP